MPRGSGENRNDTTADAKKCWFPNSAAARPETWKWLGERFAARRELLGDDEGPALASIGGLLDVVTGLSVRSRPDDAAVSVA
jgi:hypothetical protein